MLSEYLGTVTILVPVKTAPDAKPGLRTIRAKLKTQACSDKDGRCEPDVDTPLSVEVEVAANGSVKTQNAEVFAAAAKQSFYATEKTEAGPTKAATGPATQSGRATGIDVPLMTEEEQIAAIEATAYQPAQREEYPLWMLVVFALVGGTILNVMPCVLPVIPLKVLGAGAAGAWGPQEIAAARGGVFGGGDQLVPGAGDGAQEFRAVLRAAVSEHGVFGGDGIRGIGAGTLDDRRVDDQPAKRGVRDRQAADGVCGEFHERVAGDAAGDTVQRAVSGSGVDVGAGAADVGDGDRAGADRGGNEFAVPDPGGVPGGAGQVADGGAVDGVAQAGAGDRHGGGGGVSHHADRQRHAVAVGAVWRHAGGGGVLGVGADCPSPTATPARTWTVRTIVMVITLGLGAGLYTLGSAAMLDARSEKDKWVPFNMALLQEGLRQGRPVVIDWTADWCINCKVVEARVLNSDEVRRAFREHKALLLRADLTGANEPAKLLTVNCRGNQYRCWRFSRRGGSCGRWYCGISTRGSA